MLGVVICVVTLALVSAGKYDQYDPDYNIPRRSLGLGGAWFRNMWRNSRSDLYNDYDYPDYPNYVNPALTSYYNNMRPGYNNLGNLYGYPGLYNNLGGLNTGNLAMYNNLARLYRSYPALYNNMYNNLGIYNNLAGLYRGYPGLYNSMYNNPSVYNNLAAYQALYNNIGSPYTGNHGMRNLGGNLAVNSIPNGNINNALAGYGGVLGYSNVPQVAIDNDAYVPRTSVLPRKKRY